MGRIMSKIFSASRVSGFTLAGAYSVVGSWTLSEFCWSTWLAGFVLFLVTIFSRICRDILFLRRDKPLYENRFPFLRRIHSDLFFILGLAFWGVVGYAGWYLSCLVFGIYGIFLSVFSEMEPLTLFGRNGFINSDFWTPVMFLVARFWPMAAGTVIANWRQILGGASIGPGENILLSSELTRIHVMVLLIPFLSLGAWAIWGESYQTAVLLVLMALFYFWPNFFRRQAEKTTFG